VEVKSNTSNVTLRVVGGDEKGSLKSETVIFGLEYQGTRTEEDCAGKDQQDVLSSERAPHEKTVTVKQH
jgi:hypothetical protein